MATIMTIPELSKKTGFSYNVLKIFCDRYDMPTDKEHGGKGKFYIIDDNFKNKFQWWNENKRLISIKRTLEKERECINRLMEL
jgi:hypothetical protein